MNRRQFLMAAGAAGLGLAGAAAWRFWPEHGLLNPCMAGLPAEVANHELVLAAWEGLDPANRAEIAAHCQKRGAVLLTAEADGGESIAVEVMR